MHEKRPENDIIYYAGVTSRAKSAIRCLTALNLGYNIKKRVLFCLKKIVFKIFSDIKYDLKIVFETGAIEMTPWYI